MKLHENIKLFNQAITATAQHMKLREIYVEKDYWVPYALHTISSYVYNMMLASNQATMAKEYGLQPFEVQVLDTRRTICEKIMSLVRFSYSESPITELKQKLRHVYDLHQLLKDKKMNAYFQSPEFNSMLLKVANDDVASYKNNNKWLVNHPNKAFLFSNTDEVWNQLKETYINDFKHLVFGSLPDENKVYKTLVSIKERMKVIKWDVTIND